MFKWYSNKFQELLNRSKLFEKVITDNFGRSMIVFQPLRGSRSFDVRETLKLTSLQELELTNILYARIINKDDSNDEKVVKIRDFVNGHIRYASDRDTYLKPEYWADAYMVFKRKRDDCDGYAVLIMKMMELAGIPAWRRRIVAGKVITGEGHAYVVYFTETNNMWCVVEGSYYASKAALEFNVLPYTSNSRYVSTWYSFNEDSAWARTKRVYMNDLTLLK